KSLIMKNSSLCIIAASPPKEKTTFFVGIFQPFIKGILAPILTVCLFVQIFPMFLLLLLFSQFDSLQMGTKKANRIFVLPLTYLFVTLLTFLTLFSDCYGCWLQNYYYAASFSLSVLTAAHTVKGFLFFGRPYPIFAVSSHDVL
ncbi:hypothetical protein, partial [Ruminiclostridium hungatei]|uniref:hypothetical protein n=1 Tax=Ruminiclostridium hungatei TaxID=48256 RepID=UPI001A99CF6A